MHRYATADVLRIVGTAVGRQVTSAEIAAALKDPAAVETRSPVAFLFLARVPPGSQRRYLTEAGLEPRRIGALARAFEAASGIPMALACAPRPGFGRFDIAAMGIAAIAAPILMLVTVFDGSWKPSASWALALTALGAAGTSCLVFPRLGRVDGLIGLFWDIVVVIAGYLLAVALIGSLMFPGLGTWAGFWMVRLGLTEDPDFQAIAAIAGLIAIALAREKRRRAIRDYTTIA